MAGFIYQMSSHSEPVAQKIHSVSSRVANTTVPTLQTGPEKSGATVFVLTRKVLVVLLTTDLT